MRNWLSILAISLLGLLGIGCSSQVEPLKVDKFTLRNYKVESRDTPMVRGDQQKRLYGVVTHKERKARLGQYYEVRWNIKGYEHFANNPQQDGALVIFRYRQAVSASQLKLITKQYPSGITKGKVEFRVTGEEYIKKGRILAWKADLVLGGRVIETKESYLWGR